MNILFQQLCKVNTHIIKYQLLSPYSKSNKNSKLSKRNKPNYLLVKGKCLPLQRF